MSTVYDIFTKINKKWIHLMQYGYQSVPEAALWMYDISNLNQEKLDFRSMDLKKIASKVSITETWEAMQWYEDDLKQKKVTITSKISNTVYEVDTTELRIGNILFNANTQQTYTVVAVTANQITIAGTWDANSDDDDILTRIGSVKEYGSATGNVTDRNPLSDYTNYFEYVQEDISSDMITNNRTRLFVDNANDLAARVFWDASRNIIKGFASRFYFGKKEKISTGTGSIYQAGWLMEFVPQSFRVNAKWATDEETKRNIEEQLIKAYASGLDGIFGNNKLIWFVNTKFKQEVNRLYEDKLVINDRLKSIEINIEKLDLVGRTMYMVESGLLNENLPDLAIAFAVPVDHVFTYMVPNTVFDDSAKAVEKLGRGKVFIKPQTAPERKEAALFTSYSFMFQWIGSGAYRIMTIA